jgi:hypothetical protein
MPSIFGENFSNFYTMMVGWYGRLHGVDGSSHAGYGRLHVLIGQFYKYDARSHW